MEHVTHCIKYMVDLGIDDFLPEEIDMSGCTSMMAARKLDSEGVPLRDVHRNIITEQVKLITNVELFERKIELWKHRMRKKEDEHKKIESDKKLCLYAAELQMCPGVHATMDTIPKYKEVKKNQDLMSTFKILQIICYANKDGGTTFKPFKNIKLREKYISHTMDKNKSACVYKEEIKTNFKVSLSIAGHFPFGTCSLE